MRIPVALVVVILCLAFVGDCLGEVYRYKDSRGELHFVDDISRVPKKYRSQLNDDGLQGNLNVMDSKGNSGSAAGKAPEQARRNSARASAEVDVFVTSWCGYCKKMLSFLREKGIPFTAHDIETDKNAARTYHELGGSGVPVVRVGSHVVHGYNPGAVMGYYNEGK